MASCVVMKFGGTSLATPELFKQAARKIAGAHRAGERVIVVLSAMGDETDRLQSLADAITPAPSPREMDVLLSAGERVSMALMAVTLDTLGCPSRSYTGSQVPIITDSAHNRASIVEIGTRRLRQDLDAGRVPVVAGFQGVDRDGNITTLGRGGSDMTAVALAVAFEAAECRIYTDVEGVYTADPRIVPGARRLDRVTVDEMLELASLGSRVLQNRAVKFAGKHRMPLRVLSSFVEGPGTVVGAEENMMEAPVVTGIACSADEAQVTVLGAPDAPGSAHAILKPVSDAGIEVDMIVQNVSRDGRTDFSFTVQRNDHQRTLECVRRAAGRLGADDVVGSASMVKISLVGVGMRSHSGVATQLFSALSAEDINVHMVATSEIKISVLIDEARLEDAVRALHTAFGLHDARSPEMSVT